MKTFGSSIFRTIQSHKEKQFIIETLADDEQSVSIERLKPVIFTYVHDRNLKKPNKAQQIKILQKIHPPSPIPETQ